LREDRRHIQDRDLQVLRQTVQVKINLEMAADDEMTRIACEVVPGQATLVPEKREEVTTEGGLDVIGQSDRIRETLRRLHAAGIDSSLFIDPQADQVRAAREVGAGAVELHTGRYADACTPDDCEREFQSLVAAAEIARREGLLLHMGHGLTYRNVQRVARIPEVCELNIGHSIVARAVLVGFQTAVREMKELIA
jgi:pyridoxine 5-phosphate synthase